MFWDIKQALRRLLLIIATAISSLGSGCPPTALAQENVQESYIQISNEIQE